MNKKLTPPAQLDPTVQNPELADRRMFLQKTNQFAVSALLAIPLLKYCTSDPVLIDNGGVPVPDPPYPAPTAGDNLIPTPQFPGECPLVEEAVEGPFFPTAGGNVPNPEQDYDLTKVEGETEPPDGQFFYLNGRVLNQKCEPIPNADIFFWQANNSGHYHHIADQESGQKRVEPQFQYWARISSDADGVYKLKTIIPGKYPQRTPHLHYKVLHKDYVSLTTQSYFQGESLNIINKIGEWNRTDLFLPRLSARQRKAVTVNCKPFAEASEDGALIGTFNIVLASR